MNTLQKRRLWLILALAFVLIGRYVIDFIGGYFSLNEGGVFLTVLLFLLCMPVIAGVGIGWLWGGRYSSRITVGVVAFLAPWLGFFVTPPGAKTQAHGFQAALRTRSNLDQLQSWVSDALAKYEKGELKLDSEAPKTFPGRERIADSEIPTYLKRGVFSKFGQYPTIAICHPDEFVSSIHTQSTWGVSSESTTKSDRPFPCVSISWYLHGVLVGRPDFRTRWSPWYIKQIQPGIYVYEVEK
jgi:hypothetical protein